MPEIFNYGPYTCYINISIEKFSLLWHSPINDFETLEQYLHRNDGPAYTFNYGGMERPVFRYYLFGKEILNEEEYNDMSKYLRENDLIAFKMKYS